MDDWNEKLYEKRNLFITPIQISRDSEYMSKLKEIFEVLAATLEEVGADQFYSQEVNKFGTSLVEAIKDYYYGRIDSAQEKVDSLIGKFDNNDTTAISHINNSISFCSQTHPQEVQFFRARCNSKTTDYKKEEMLHIPFSKRSIIKTSRFSVPGLPCLYLGTTSYVCWMELGRPADHEFNVSPVILDNTQRILNLAVNFGDFIFANKCAEEITKTIFRLWLLSIATSFKVREENRSFKSEYIISQLIMLSCMKKGLSGLTYYSKQVENDCFACSVGVNLALFAYLNEKNDLSDICNHLYVSDSFNYSMYKHLTIPQTFRRAKLRIDNIVRMQNIGTFERQYPYRETEFYSFDNYLYAYLKPDALFHI